MTRKTARLIEQLRGSVENEALPINSAWDLLEQAADEIKNLYDLSIDLRYRWGADKSIEKMRFNRLVEHIARDVEELHEILRID